MRHEDLLLLGVLLFIGVQRLGELVVSRRNTRRMLARGGVLAPADGLAPLVVVHVGLLVLLPLEWFLAPWSRVGPHTWPLLALAVAANGLRYWAAWTLGSRYSVRVVRLPHVLLTRQGPYRWSRHPIYVAVAIEVAAWPLAFSAWASGLLLGVGNLLALRRRIRIEERHLAASPTA